MTSKLKTRETRLRRMAGRQGLAVRKNRRRDPRARDYGRYWLLWVEASLPERSHDAWVGYPNGFDIDQVEAYLGGNRVDLQVAEELERTQGMA